ncbi:uncharacterized protein G2W53_025042 [Senna tora]|uniref:Uncharacterized protein n=1 Tax=Senna tora TaxID=362788 RepID=A0A834TEJ1_9FABA|nr:uncharacterized protein G2W53_025042 [Senna tora]
MNGVLPAQSGKKEKPKLEEGQGRALCGDKKMMGEEVELVFKNNEEEGEGQLMLELTAELRLVEASCYSLGNKNHPCVVYVLPSNNRLDGNEEKVGTRAKESAGTTSSFAGRI